MTREQIIRAWKDASYRNSLSPADRASLPENPAGVVEISDAQLGELTGAKGGNGSTHYIVCGTALCPTKFTCSGTLCEPISWPKLAVAG